TGMHVFDTARKANELGQLYAMALVESRYDMRNELVRPRLAPIDAFRWIDRQRGQGGNHQVQVQALLCRCFSQRLVATATEVQLKLVKYAGSAGDGTGECAQRLVRQVFVHLASSLKWYGFPHYI